METEDMIRGFAALLEAGLRHIDDIVVQCILVYPAMLGNLFPKSWPDKHLAG